MGLLSHVMVVEKSSGTVDTIVSSLGDLGIRGVSIEPGLDPGSLKQSGAPQPQAILVDGSCFRTDNNVSETQVQDLARNLAKLSQLAIDDHIPMILLAGQGDQEKDFLPSAPWDDILVRPVTARQIANRISSLARLGTMQSELDRRITTSARYGIDAPAEINQPPCFDDAAILILGTGLQFANIERVLSKHATLTGAFTSDTATEYLHRRDFDAVLVEVQKDGRAALEFAESVRRHSRFFNLPLIALGSTSHDDWSDIAIEAGYTEVLSACIPDEDLERRTLAHVKENRYRESLRSIYRKARHMSTSDGLTGLYSRGFLFEHLRTMIADTGPCPDTFSVVAFGIRDMAGLNEAYDYAVGDRMLRQVGEVMSYLLRGEDLASRYSGSTFVAILPDTDPDASLAAALRITSVIRHTEFSVPEVEGPVNIDISSGVAGYVPEETPEELVARALSWLQT